MELHVVLERVERFMAEHSADVVDAGVPFDQLTGAASPEYVRGQFTAHASFLGCGDGVLREVDKAWGALTIEQHKMSDAVHTALVEAAAIAYKHESVRSAIRPALRISSGTSLDVT